MTTNNIDWLESGYFYRNTNNVWVYKINTPQWLIRQFENFMKVQNKLYGNNF